jgi:hypothetical protein
MDERRRDGAHDHGERRLVGLRHPRPCHLLANVRRGGIVVYVLFLGLGVLIS